MITNISNNVVINTTSATSGSGNVSRALPLLNSVVGVNVLDKMSGNYKILVDGTLFQSKLPFSAEIGDQLVAKVLSHNPFTLGIDNFAQLKGIDASLLPAMLAKLELSDNEISKLVLKKVLGSNKPAVKSKIKKIIEYLESSDLIIDELSIGLLINIMWNDPLENEEELFSSFDKIFDVSFEELSTAIFAYVETINELAPEEIISKNINSVLLFSPTNHGAKENLIALKDKSKEFVQLVKTIVEKEERGTLPYRISKELQTIKLLMLKYVLQKSLFNRFDTHPEFTIVDGVEGLQLVNFKIDRINNETGELSFNINSLIHRTNYGEFIFDAYSTKSKLSGELAVDYENVRMISEGLNRVNENLSKELNVYSGIKVTLKETFSNNNQDRPTSIKSIDTVA